MIGCRDATGLNELGAVEDNNAALDCTPRLKKESQGVRLKYYTVTLQTYHKSS